MDAIDVADFFEKIAKYSGGRALLPRKNGQQYLKVDGKILGGSIYVYMFFADKTPAEMLKALITEILLPIKEMGLAESYKHGADQLKRLGHKIFPPESHGEFDTLF